MTWFMDPMPDGDTVHQVAASMRTVQGAYSPHIQTVQTTHDQTVIVWGGNDSTAHTQVTTATQQASQEHAGWLVALADTFQVLGTLLKIIFVLQMAWLAIQAATVIWGIFTAGLDALVTEGPAAALAVVIQGMRQMVVSLLTALAKALASRLVQAGVLIGGATGLGVGINTVESQHLSGWQAFLTIAGDTFTGAGAGMTIALDPLALAGTGVGVGQVATQSALGNPTDVQSAFNLITFDTFAASGFDSGDPANGDLGPIERNRDLSDEEAYQQYLQRMAQQAQTPEQYIAQAYQTAEKYGIDLTVNGEPVQLAFDPNKALENPGGTPEGYPPTINLGRGAFTDDRMLGGTLVHEMVHIRQLAENGWVWKGLPTEVVEPPAYAAQYEWEAWFDANFGGK